MTFQIFIRLSTNIAKLRFLLHLQTMGPCQVKIQGNLFGVLITAEVADLSTKLAGSMKLSQIGFIILRFQILENWKVLKNVYQWFLRQFFDMALSLVSLQVKKEDVGFVTELTGVRSGH